MGHSAILSTCTKHSPAFATFVLSIFEWQLKTCFTVFCLQIQILQVLTTETIAIVNLFQVKLSDCYHCIETNSQLNW